MFEKVAKIVQISPDFPFVPLPRCNTLLPGSTVIKTKMSTAVRRYGPSHGLYVDFIFICVLFFGKMCCQWSL